MMDQIGRLNAVFKASFFDLSQILCLYFVFPLVYLSSKYYQIIQAVYTDGRKLSFWKTVSLSKSPLENVIHLAYKQSHSHRIHVWFVYPLNMPVP